MRRLSLLALSGLLLTPADAISDNAPKVDRSGKGAVLCAWQLYQAASFAGANCHPNEDAAFRDELNRSLGRIDAFIIANSKPPVTAATLDLQRAQMLKSLHAASDLCASTPEHLYLALHRLGPDKLREAVADLLSVPREPVMNPCL